MAKPGVLFLLLAVAASHVDLLTAQTVVTGSGNADISACPITFYGREYSLLDLSFTTSAAKICFKSSTTQTSQDCVEIEDKGSADTMVVTKKTSSITGSSLAPHLTNITSTSTCQIQITLKDASQEYLNAYFDNFGVQTALEIKTTSAYASGTVKVTAKFGTSILDSRSFSNTDAANNVYMDLSGCRVSGDPIKANSNKVVNAETCSIKICSASAVLSSGSSCNSNEICQGNNTCGPPPFVCTVIGPTIIDFFGRVLTAPDRCGYSLMKSHQNSDFNLLAGFRDRWRTDVSMLDYLILLLNDAAVKISLEQGGKVMVDDQIQTLNATPSVVHGVELSKDQNGVTVKILSAKVTVSFDGNTAHVAVEDTEDVVGLCGSSSNPSETTTMTAQKSSSESENGCEIVPTDTTVSSINCNASPTYCDIMSKAPFTACNDHVDPDPFITACNETLCKYPSVDGVKCQFLEAYATSCDLRSDIVLGDWRSEASCSPTPSHCLDLYCSSNEFCGDTFGDASCHCRAIFASNYKPTDSLGDPTFCKQDSATVTLAGCLLAEKGIEYSELHLNDENCTGHMDSDTHMVTFSFNGNKPCGVEVLVNNSQVIYKNTIMTSNSSTNGTIIRGNKATIDFSCYYTQPQVRNVGFLIKDGSVVQHIVSENYNYTLMMKAYYDPGRTELVNSSIEIGLNQKIWVELETTGLDEKLVAVVTDSCWATSKESPDGSPKHDLISNGCPNPADQTVRVVGNGLGTSNYFSFNMFEFAGESNELYLHCQLKLCPTNGRSCAPACGSGGNRRRRSFRSKYADETPALMTMAWSN